ncbi:hypothetical protein H4582DRAFT_2084025 [Lactarius indigo]|nr:hypothetical protein H4582DRAFT_2084025 [Lactarius indigo]
MNSAYVDEKIVDLSEEELTCLGFLGEGVAPGIQDHVKVKANPEYLGSVTCFMVDCLTRVYQAEPTAQDGTKLPTSPTPRPSALDMVSKYEMHFYYHYYHGVGDLQLMWRSDLELNPFPIPATGTCFFKIPTETAHGIFSTKLNKIIALMKASGLHYSALTTARFSTVEDGKEPTLSHVTVWIAVRPNTAKPRDVCDYEGSVVRLDGPPLMSLVKNSDAKFGFNTPFNIGLGISIARHGDSSNRVLAFTNKHVTSLDTTTDYELDEADPQHILVCGERRLNLAITEIEKAVAKGFHDAVRLFEEVEKLEKALGTDEEDTQALDRKRNALKEKNEDHAGLKELYDEVKGEWKDSNGRRLGIVDWAPEIAVRVDERGYTRDIAMFAVDGEKLKNFVRNSVDLVSSKTTSGPSIPVRKGRKIPASLQLPICPILPRLRVLNPDTMDKNGNPLYIVGKYGNATKFTLGCYLGMEGIFAPSSDSSLWRSPSLIFTGDGDALAMLHSGMPRGMHNHVTYGTPMWWVIKQVRLKYPSAEFYGITYTLED